MLLQNINAGVLTPIGFQTNRQFINSCLDYHAWFESIGISPGDLIAIRMMHTDNHLKTIFAIENIQAISIDVNSFSSDRIRDIVKELNVTKVLVDKAEHGLPSDLPVFIVSEEFIYAEPRCHGQTITDSFLVDQPFRVFSSSGTTGDSKLIPVSIKSFLGRLETRKITNPVAPGSKLLLGMHLMAEVSFNYATYYLSQGSDVVFPRSFDSTDLLVAIRDQSVTHLITTPYIFDRFVTFLKFTGVRLNELQMVYLVGAQPSINLINSARELMNAEIYSDYGSTETGVIAYGKLESVSPTKVGRIADPKAIEIVDEIGNPMPVGQLGWVSYIGPNLCDPYWMDDVKSAIHFSEGRFISGDLGRITTFGDLKIEGRIDDVINRGGVKFTPSSIEELLVGQPGIQECAAFGVPFNGAIAVVLAVVGNLSDQEKAVLKAFTLKFDEFLRPDLIVYLKSLPRNANGKISRKTLSEFFTGKLGSS